MSDPTGIPELDRVTFFPGQRLTAPDLTELARVTRELRWLHTRSLHPWGIGIGLEVTGERGASRVRVDPGFAVDCLGREIILSARLDLEVPSIAGAGNGEATRYLVAAYADDAHQTAERRAGVCRPAGTVRLTEEPHIRWLPAEQLREGLHIVLAQAWIRNCRLSRAVSPAPRRSARPSQQAYVATGQTKAGSTAWTLWAQNGASVGVELRVDTTDAQFRMIPRYWVEVVGDRYSNAHGALVLGVPAIVEASADEFKLSVLLPPMGGGNLPINPAALRNVADQVVTNELDWCVTWVGVEG